MKKMNLLLAGLLFFGMVSCSDDDSSSTNNQNTGEIISNAQSGTWKISSFIEETNDETHHFNGYNFTFGANNTVTATNGTNTYTGTWSVTHDSSNDDDSPSSDIDFNINFSSPAQFTDLSDDWDIIEVTNNKISLIDVSGGNGGTDYLTFTKN